MILFKQFSKWHEVIFLIFIRTTYKLLFFILLWAKDMINHNEAHRHSVWLKLVFGECEAKHPYPKLIIKKKKNFRIFFHFDFDFEHFFLFISFHSIWEWIQFNPLSLWTCEIMLFDLPSNIMMFSWVELSWVWVMLYCVVLCCIALCCVLCCVDAIFSCAVALQCFCYQIFHCESSSSLNIKKEMKESKTKLKVKTKKKWTKDYFKCI